MKNLVDLRQKSNDELQNRLNEIATIFIRIKTAASTASELSSKSGQSGANTSYIWKLRKERARILTILNERKREVKA